ncbi:MAG: O-methyltransferase [Saprospiraceae bacterium]|nr:O-methyltransferase [Saprospiraceae bacterium]
MIPTSFLQDQLNRYCEEHSNGIHKHLRYIERSTYEKCLAPQMLSGSIQGRLLSLISKLIKPNLSLEIGTFTGYSALCIAEGLVKDGVLHTIEVSHEYLDFANYIKDNVPNADQIHFHIGDAFEVIPTISGCFDLVFLDAGKKDYLRFVKMLEPRMLTGSILICDNVLWSGKVLETLNDSDTKALQELNLYLYKSTEWEVVILPMRDGISLAIRK